MIKIQLNDFQRQELENLRFQASSKDSEKALMILLSADGKSVPKIANIVKRNPHTVRDWLKRYKDIGITGLSRKFSPGRPGEKRELVKKHIKEIIKFSPEHYSYTDTVWTVPLIAHDISKEIDIHVSEDTVTRALKNLGYSYKRPSKKPVENEKLSREDKVGLIRKMVSEIEKVITQKDIVIYSLDESHFSNEPYLTRGWFFKRWPPQDTDTKKKRKSHLLWMLESKNKKILLEEVEQL